MTHSPEHLSDDLAAVWKAADDLLDALIHLEGHDLPDNARTELSSIIDQHAAHEADLAEFRRTLAWLAVAVATIFGLGIAFALPLIAALTA